jgi:hypothetical protein
MKVARLIAFVFFAIILHNTANAQLFIFPNKVVVAGFVFDESTKEPLPYVNVYIKKSRRGTITDTLGFFVLYSKPLDTIIFSSIGYERLFVEVNDSLGDVKEPAMVYLKPKIYEIASVDIIALKRYQQFKYDFTNMEMPTDDDVYNLKYFPLLPPELAYYQRSGSEGFGLVMHPISALYDVFSKEGRQRRKLLELETKDATQLIIDEKYNAKMVSDITGLSIEQAEIFMTWSNLNDNLILSITEYELIEIIIRQFKQYKKIE